jgi:hypothetical protein
VYHVGALGGGHYIATGRDMSDHLAKIIATAEGEEGTTPPEKVTSPGPTTPSGAPKVQWWCYNDSTVTPVTAEKDIVSSSAYVLFYLRKDIQHSRFQDIHCVPSSAHSSDHTANSSSATGGELLTAAGAGEGSEGESKSARTLLGESMSEAKHKVLSRLIPPTLGATRVSGGGDEEGGRSGGGDQQSENQDNCQIS